MVHCLAQLAATIYAFHVHSGVSLVCVCVYLCSVPTSDQWVSNNCPRHLQSEHPTPDYLRSYQVSFESVIGSHH